MIVLPNKSLVVNYKNVQYPLNISHFAPGDEKRKYRMVVRFKKEEHVNIGMLEMYKIDLDTDNPRWICDDRSCWQDDGLAQAIGEEYEKIIEKELWNSFEQEN